MKELHSFLELAVRLGEVVVAEHEADKHALNKVARMIEKRAKEKIGEYQDQAGPFVAWAELADATKEDRARQGYPEDEPLLRTGDMRDSIEHQVEDNVAQIGSNSDIAVYQELGTSKIPPRSFLAGAAVEKLEKIKQIVGESAYAALIGKGVHNGSMEIE